MAFSEITPRLSRHGHAPALRPLLLARRVAQWRALARQRRALKRMDADQLHDLGLSRDAADAEAARPFWDAPAHWTI
ncbi:DUF1127 domain-containing protein [Cognatishimia sp. F0-27]|uniref:DUF1127 domain-containing protein n=1 Tax=Cognatishimia sp. F0-27 TaxID=2816855 RepID=UPI001D0CA6AD|nr:DUF1127 domain-containing protein [Cognatishimia sp. F0-27]MCC1495116.1 DUF1127 domain-containing protein [Cognatishimia sp. F0-27]